MRGMRLLAAALPILASAPALAAEGPELAKLELVVSTKNHNEYVPEPGKRDDLTYSWTPKVQLTIYGPTTAGQEYVVDFSTPEGKPWVSLKLDTPEVAAKTSATLEGGANLPVEKAITATGDLAFVVHLKDEAKGKDDVVFKGKATVKKFHVNGNIPKYKNTFYYY